MKRVEILEAILYNYLNLLSDEGIQLIKKELKTEVNSKNFIDFINKYFRLDSSELQEEINLGKNDIEDMIFFLYIFLWKQENNKFKKELRAKIPKYYKKDDLWRVHRYMVSNGYENISKCEYEIIDGTITNYQNEIEKYIDIYKINTKQKNDTEWIDNFYWLAHNLNVIGPKIQSSKFYTGTKNFIEYILQNFEKDERVRYMYLSSFTMLIYDTKYSVQKTWPVYKYLLNNWGIGIHDYDGAILGIRIYGDLAREELEKIKIPGGFRLLNALASNYS